MTSELKTSVIFQKFSFKQAKEKTLFKPKYQSNKVIFFKKKKNKCKGKQRGKFVLIFKFGKGWKEVLNSPKLKNLETHVHHHCAKKKYRGEKRFQVIVCSLLKARCTCILTRRACRRPQKEFTHITVPLCWCAVHLRSGHL